MAAEPRRPLMKHSFRAFDIVPADKQAAQPTSRPVLVGNKPEQTDNTLVPAGSTQLPTAASAQAAGTVPAAGSPEVEVSSAVVAMNHDLLPHPPAASGRADPSAPHVSDILGMPKPEDTASDEQPSGVPSAEVPSLAPRNDELPLLAHSAMPAAASLPPKPKGLGLRDPTHPSEVPAMTDNGQLDFTANQPERPTATPEQTARLQAALKELKHDAPAEPASERPVVSIHKSDYLRQVIGFLAFTALGVLIVAVVFNFLLDAGVVHATFHPLTDWIPDRV